MKIQRFQLLGHLLLPLVLAVSGCNTFPLLKNKEKPPPHKEEPPAKKIEEPVVKKPEPPEKTPLATSRIAEQELGWGIRKYEEGEHKIAARNFQNALSSGLSSTDQVTAHKYLAFIYCGSGEKLACRGEFKEILKLNPRFNLTPAEAGHPIWGPVFREVRAEVPGKKKQKR
jgi:hypothetical protein